NGVMAEHEFLRLSARGDTLVYTAMPSGQAMTEFRATTVADTLVRFETRAHDFPQVILYRRTAPDSILARIEGPGPDNSTRGVSFPMRRISCTDVPAPTPPPDTLLIAMSVSPDGGRFVVVKGASNNWDLFLTNAEAGEARRLTDHSAVDYQPAWSPDGSRIAFVSSREGHQEIYTIAPDGTGLRRLTSGAAHNGDPAWSPDGRTIAFRSNRESRPQVWLMNADGTDQRRVTQDTAGAGAPSWSPDGRRLLFSSTRNRHGEIHVMNVDGTGITQLTTTDPGHSGLPMWSPDGRTILFWSTRDGNEELYIMDADGSNARNITNHAARDVPVGWTPDGRHVLFRSTRDRAANELYRMRPDGTELLRLPFSR
ncbi:MAG TPA: DUF6265 family protein, partial [Longimicrobiales bacterium]|nr:DUF6265 family protein [Longimicrobiales bacterium]